jgi:hypothetical protein
VAVDRLLLLKVHPGVKVRELLPIYQPVKHFQHMIKTRHFFILTDHMPIIFAFQQKKDKFDQLDDLLFTTEIRYVFEHDNVVADAIPRTKSIAAFQVDEDEVRTLLDWNTSRLEKVSRHLPAILRQICRKYSVIRTSTPARQALDSLHNLSSREKSARLNSLPRIS